MALADLIHFRINALDPKAQSEHDAWTDADAMRVLSDRLLEEGAVYPMTDYEAKQQSKAYASMQPEDLALYTIECQVRTWLMRDCDRGFQLRVTGGWPDIRFVVLYQPNLSRSGSAGERLAFRGAPRDGQPRLLRTAPQSGEDA